MPVVLDATDINLTVNGNGELRESINAFIKTDL
jgi:hypothetical protein